VYRTGAVAPAIAALVTAIAAQITADSDGQYTATNNGNNLRIQGNLGALTTEVYGFSMFMNIGFAQTVVTALAQPQGTPAIIARDVVLLIDYLDEIDRRRGTNWRDLFPWLDQDWH
jgi:hypothetical protein